MRRRRGDPGSRFPGVRAPGSPVRTDPIPSPECGYLSAKRGPLNSSAENSRGPRRHCGLRNTPAWTLGVRLIPKVAMTNLHRSPGGQLNASRSASQGDPGLARPLATACLSQGAGQFQAVPQPAGLSSSPRAKQANWSIQANLLLPAAIAKPRTRVSVHPPTAPFPGTPPSVAGRSLRLPAGSFIDQPSPMPLLPSPWGRWRRRPGFGPLAAGLLLMAEDSGPEEETVP